MPMDILMERSGSMPPLRNQKEELNEMRRDFLESGQVSQKTRVRNKLDKIWKKTVIDDIKDDFMREIKDIDREPHLLPIEKDKSVLKDDGILK